MYYLNNSMDMYQFVFSYFLLAGLGPHQPCQRADPHQCFTRQKHPADICRSLPQRSMDCTACAATCSRYRHRHTTHYFCNYDSHLLYIYIYIYIYIFFFFFFLEYNYYSVLLYIRYRFFFIAFKLAVFYYYSNLILLKEYNYYPVLFLILLYKRFLQICNKDIKTNYTLKCKGFHLCKIKAQKGCNFIE